jgi:hypothetical protein
MVSSLAFSHFTLYCYVAEEGVIAAVSATAVEDAIVIDSGANLVGYVGQPPVGRVACRFEGCPLASPVS